MAGESATTFFDDIIKTMKIEAETAKFAVLTPETLREFYADAPKAGSPPPFQQTQTAPRQARSATQWPTAPTSTPRAGGQNHQRPPQFAQTAGAPQAPPTPMPQTPAATPAEIARMDMRSLNEAVRKCAACPLAAQRRNVVFGAGSENAELMFIGEGPGRDEDAQGVPFVGEAGQLLTKMINAMTFARSEVYIANIIKCRPPGNRNPEDAEAAACLPYLRRQIEIVRPKVIVLLGAIALKYLMGVSGIMRSRGKWMDYNGIKVMPTFHPAYLLRNDHAKKEVWQDLQKVMSVFGRSRSPVTRR